MTANYRFFVGSGSGTWTAPRTGLYFLNGCGAGGPGGGGYPTAGGGGGGGASGKFMMGYPAYLYSGDTIAYSIGAATSGGTPGNAGTAGGSTALTFTSQNELLNGQTITLNGGGSGSAGASTNGGSGGSIGGIITGGAGGSGAGGNGARMSTAMGGGSFVGANSGAAGGAVNFAGGLTSGASNLPGYVFSDSASNAGNSNASNGGGGAGGPTPWGNGGVGGKASTSTPPTAGTGYGAGGGGGYGGVAGAAGSGGFFEVLNYDNIPASLPTMATDWITSAGVSAGAVTKIQTGLASQSSVNAIPTTPLLAANYTAPDNTSILAIKTKTDNLPSSPAAVGSAMTLTSAYDAAKTAASQSSVNALPGTVSVAVVDISLTGHTTAGTLGGAVNAAGASADPWGKTATELAAYGNNTAAHGMYRLLMSPGAGAVVVLPDPSTDADKCVIYLDTESLTGELMAGIEVCIELSGYPSQGNRMLEAIVDKIVTGSDGRATASITRTDRIDPAGRTYRFKCPLLGVDVSGVVVATDLLDLATVFLPE